MHRRIRTHNLSKRAAKDLRLRPRGHWDRLRPVVVSINPHIRITIEVFLAVECNGIISVRHY